MDINKSNYQEYTFPDLLEQYDKILVPMIQRDYAQGRTDKKATDVRNNLLTDIFSEKNVHFDLVFGSKEKRIIESKEKNCFIPVDGQQRLTTLFLLYLYGKKAGKTNTELDLSKFSYDTRRAASDFCKSITSEEWAVLNEKVSDVIKDSSWFMNYWEKDPTVEGMLNMLDAIQEKCKGTTVYPDLSKFRFYFFDLESNGLNENLYLKMNSRGKPLTAFENLKAKIEKVLPENIEIEVKWFPKCDASPKDSFKEKWKYFMDRNWTEVFWDSANQEKYDESITKFIVRFLSGYWAAYGEDKDEEQKQQITDELKFLNRKENYADFIPFEPIKKVLDLKNAFSTLAYALTTVPEIKSYWTNDTKVSEKSEYKFLAVIFTYVLFDGDKDAMRFAWNMAENYVTGYDNFITFCTRVAEIYKFKFNENVSFYKALSSQKIDDNTSSQMKEEINKAEQIINGGDEWETKIVVAEKDAFFKGAIRFLFTDGEGSINWNDFDTKWGKAKEYFDENGVREKYKAQLTKALVIQCDDWGNQLYDKEIFNPNGSTWKWILCADNWKVPINNILTKELNKIKKTTINKDPNIQTLIIPLLDKLPFEDMMEKVPNGRFRWYGHLAFYNNKSNVIVFDWDNFHRNKILVQLMDNGKISVSNERSSIFFWWWDINFKYNNHNFQWHRNDHVYLMDDNKKIPTGKSSGSAEEQFICKYVAGISDVSKLEEVFKGLIIAYEQK